MNLSDMNAESKKSMKKAKLPKVKVEKEKNKDMKPAKSKKTMADYVLNGLLAFFCIGFIVVVGFIVNYHQDIKKAEKTYEEIQPSSEFEMSSEKPMIFVDYNGRYVWDRYLDAYMNNQDLVGWITIDDTVIDYPVMQTVGDNEYYLHRDFNKQYSSAGTIFADEKSDVNTLTDNVLLYGHHMKAGTMFASLEEYENKEYAVKHKTVYFDTLDGRNEYEVIASFRISISNDKFKYYMFYKDSENFPYEDFISEVKSRSYLTVPELNEKEQFLTLSTCDYHESNGRFVVVCRKVNDTGEHLREYMTLEEYKSNTKK